MVVHLDDLLLRRTRVGNLTEAGAEALLEKIRPLCEAKLGWDSARWEQEVSRYQDIWQRYYSVAPADIQAAAA